MSSSWLPRWTALLVLPLLAGALLLMHGLDVTVGPGVHAAAAAVPSHPIRGEAPADHEGEPCTACAAGHVMVACAAVIATIAGLLRSHRSLATRLGSSVHAVSERLHAADGLLRPLEPAWVRLAVMRC